MRFIPGQWRIIEMNNPSADVEDLFENDVKGKVVALKFESEAVGEVISAYRSITAGRCMKTGITFRSTTCCTSSSSSSSPSPTR